MPLPELRMAGKEELAAQASGKLPEKLLPLRAMIVSFGSAFAPPHGAGRVPFSVLSVSVISLQGNLAISVIR